MVSRCRVVQSLHYIWLFAIPWTTACQASLSFTISQSLFKFMSIESVRLFIHLILCHHLLLLPLIFPSIWVFSNESALHIRWPKYWSFSISPSNEYTGLISFRILWFDLFSVQGSRHKSHLHHLWSKKLGMSLFIMSLSLFFFFMECNPWMGWPMQRAEFSAHHMVYTQRLSSRMCQQLLETHYWCLGLTIGGQDKYFPNPRGWVSH